MSTFTYKSFKVNVNTYRGGFGYNAYNGKHRMVQPNPGFGAIPYPTESEAEAAAKQAIFMYEVTAMLTALPESEQLFVAYITERLYKKDWIVEAKSDVIQLMMKPGRTRRRS